MKRESKRSEEKQNGRNINLNAVTVETSRNRTILGIAFIWSSLK